jgi:hypothetical protein
VSPIRSVFVPVYQNYYYKGKLLLSRRQSEQHTHIIPSYVPNFCGNHTHFTRRTCGDRSQFIMLSVHMELMVKSDQPHQSISLVVDNAKSHNESTTMLSCVQLMALSHVVVSRNLRLCTSSFLRLELESSRNPTRTCALPSALEKDTEAHKQGSFESLVESFLGCKNSCSGDHKSLARSGIRSSIKQTDKKARVSSGNRLSIKQTDKKVSARSGTGPMVPRSFPRAQSFKNVFVSHQWKSDTVIVPPPPALSRWQSDNFIVPPPPALSRWKSEPTSGSLCMFPAKPSSKQSTMSLPDFRRSSSEPIDCLFADDDLSAEITTSSHYGSSTSLISFSSTPAYGPTNGLARTKIEI